MKEPGISRQLGLKLYIKLLPIENYFQPCHSRLCFALKYLNVCVFGESTNFKISDVIIRHYCIFDITLSIVSIKMKFCQILIGSSHRRCSVRKRVPRNFANFTGKHVCQILIKFQASVYSKALAWVFSSEFCKISKNIFLQNTSGRLLLHIRGT